MARRYFVQGSINSGSNKTAASVVSTTAIRPKIYDILIGSPATPADQCSSWAVQRFTADGTSTAFTPVALDPGDPASTSSAGITYTVEPTYTANKYLLEISVNQRASFRWVAAPNSELILPATASNGAGLRTLSATGTATHNANIMFEE